MAAALFLVHVRSFAFRSLHINSPSSVRRPSYRIRRKNWKLKLKPKETRVMFATRDHIRFRRSLERKKIKNKFVLMVALIETNYLTCSFEKKHEFNLTNEVIAHHRQLSDRSNYDATRTPTVGNIYISNLTLKTTRRRYDEMMISKWATVRQQRPNTELIEKYWRNFRMIAGHLNYLLFETMAFCCFAAWYFVVVYLVWHTF